MSRVLSGRGQSMSLALDRIGGHSIWNEIIGRTSLGFMSKWWAGFQLSTGVLGGVLGGVLAGVLAGVFYSGRGGWFRLGSAFSFFV